MTASSVHFPMNNQGVNYFVYLSRMDNGSTWVGLTNVDKLMHESDEDGIVDMEEAED